MTNKLKEQALNKWFNNITTDIQKESFKFQDSCIPFGAGLGIGVICKHFKELQEIVDDDGWIEIKTRESTWEEKEKFEDRIIVAYDEHIQSSPCLVVARKCNDEMHLINTFWNDKAKRLYRELTEKKDG